MILYIIVPLAVLLLFLLAFMLVRTATFMETPPPPEPAASLAVEVRPVAEHLSEVIRVETEDRGPGEPPAPVALTELRALLSRLYPGVHGHLQRRVMDSGALVFVWTGSRHDLLPVLLAAHMDVVPIDPTTRDQWQYPPFSGEIAEGYLWGRGTLDDKGQVVAILEAVENLIKTGYQPERTIYLAFGIDEEIGGEIGAGAIAAALEAEGIQLAAVLDEGGGLVEGLTPGVKAPVATVGVAEKGYLSVHLTATGIAGHSATPARQTAIGALGRALARLDAAQFPARFKAIETLYRKLGSGASFGIQFVMANLWLLGGLVQRMTADAPNLNAIIRTTIAPTIVKGGIKDNILPAQAEAVINLRLLPGETVESALARLRRIIADERVTVEATEASWDPTPTSDVDTAIYRSLSTAIRQTFPGSLVAPYLVLGATDARHYSGICTQVYRFTPYIMNKEELGRVHGVNERIALDALAPMVQFYGHLVQAWGAEALE